jgi:Uri superfamily endonuclease
VNFLPRSPGGYILELHLTQPRVLQIGRLGEFTFPAGAYLYFGSACGPGGLHARLARHLLPASSQPVHWQIDYLHSVAEARALGYLAFACQEQAAQHMECLWSQAVAGLPGSLAIVPGFGASDCRLGCPAHLLAIQKAGEAKGPVLLDRRLQNVLAQAAASAGVQQNLCWISIDQY